MGVNTGNFHAFFPQGCYRKKLTPRRKEIFTALDIVIQRERFDMVVFDQTKQAYLAAMDSEKEKDAFLRLNELIALLFSLMLKQGFSEKELQNWDGLT